MANEHNEHNDGDRDGSWDYSNRLHRFSTGAHGRSSGLVAKLPRTPIPETLAQHLLAIGVQGRVARQR